MLRMDAGVYDEADGAPDIGFKAAVIADGVLVKADLFTEALTIKCPAFYERGV